MANKIFPNKILSWNFKIEFCFNRELARKVLFSAGIHSLQGWTATIWQGVTIKRSTIRLKHTACLGKSYSQKVSINSILTVA